MVFEYKLLKISNSSSLIGALFGRRTFLNNAFFHKLKLFDRIHRLFGTHKPINQRWTTLLEGNYEPRRVELGFDWGQFWRERGEKHFKLIYTNENVDHDPYRCI